MPITTLSLSLQESKLGQKTDRTTIETNTNSTYTKTLESSIRFLFYAMIIIIPLAIYPSALSQALSIKYLLFKIMTIVIVCLYLITILLKGTEIRVSGLELPLAIFLILVAAATALSINVHTSIEGNYIRYDGFLSYLICGVLFFIATQSFNSIEHVERIAKLSIAIATVVSFYGIAQSYGYDPVPWGYMMFEKTRSFSTFGNPVILSGYLSLVFPLAIALLLRSKSTTEKLLYSLATAAMVYCSVTSLSRAAWLGGVIGLALVLVGLVKKKSFNIRMATIPVMIGAIVVFLTSITIGLPVITQRAASTFGFDGSVDSRLLMWKTVLKMIPERPLFGYGPDVLGLVFPKHEVPDLLKYDLSGTIDNVHNAFLQLALTAGIPALIAFVVIIVLLLIKASKEIRDNETVSPVTIGLTAGIAAFLVQSLTGVTGIATSGFLWLNMGLLATSWAEPKIEFKPTSRFAKYSLVSFIVLVGVIAVILSVRHFISEYALGQAWLTTREDSKKAESFYRKAIAYNPQDDKAYSGLGIMLADNGYASRNKKLWSKGMDYLNKSTKLSPYNREDYTFLGLGYLYGGKAFDKHNFYFAVKNLRKAAELDPNNFTTRDLLGMAYLETGQLQKARNNLTMAQKLNPNDAQTHYHMGRYYEKVGQPEHALKEYSDALKIDESYQDAKTAYERLTNHGNDRSLKFGN